jgi:hypothetical protein
VAVLEMKLGTKKKAALHSDRFYSFAFFAKQAKTILAPANFFAITNALK